MKALTLWQPWASLIAIGVKTIETRSWPAPKALVGQRVAIHAAKRPSDTEADFQFDTVLHEHGTCFVDLPLGAIVAVVDVVDSLPVEALWWSGLPGWHGWHYQCGGAPLRKVLGPDSNPGPHRWPTHPVVAGMDQRPYGDYSEGRFAWLLDAVDVLDKPIPATGRQGIWEWSGR